jgi:hypothetical protein
MDYIKFKIIFKWYDFWIGLFWDRHRKMLYIFPIPMLGIRISFNRLEEREHGRDVPDSVEPKEKDTFSNFQKRYR